MKKFYTFIAAVLLCVTSSAQEKVSFLGVPVDGNKKLVIQKLQRKDFKIKKGNTLTGIFDKREVEIAVISEHGKTCRIAVLYSDFQNQYDVIKTFNELYEKFKKNDNYRRDVHDRGMVDLYDIDNFEEKVKKNGFKASFCQIKTDRPTINNREIKNFGNLTDLRKEELYPSSIKRNEIERLWKEAERRSVWFRIAKYPDFDKYAVWLYYDNLINIGNSSDL